MATLQKRGSSWRVLFCFDGNQTAYTIGEASESEARRWKGRTEQLLMRLDQGLLELPIGVRSSEFLKLDGKVPPPVESVKARQTSLHQLREAYLSTHCNGAIEPNTLATARIHLSHLEETLGKNFLVSGLSLAKLQSHVNRRQAEVSPITSKKEIDTFRAAWNWGMRLGMIDKPFPGKAIAYPKTAEKLPFMSWEEIECRIKSGGDEETLWECLYLTPTQVTELLAFVKEKPAQSWLYPMLFTAAHTGARRSELMRAKTEDVDLVNGIITLREKKRVRGKCTTRRIPMTKLLAEVLKPILEGNCGYLFGNGIKELTNGHCTIAER